MGAAFLPSSSLAALDSFEELDLLSPAESRAVMPTKSGTSGDALVERLVRTIFVHAIVHRCSDVHVISRGDPDKPNVHVSIRHPEGLKSYLYDGENGRHFADKLFSLTGTPQGGSMSSVLSTRFSVEAPAAFARKHGLTPRQNEPYVVDLRVEYIRTYDGWAFTCRLLDQQRAPRLGELGLSYVLLRALRRAMAEPSGLILVSGPTGCGKSTLLNAILGELNDGSRSIGTIENPVEYRLEQTGAVKQISVDGKVSFGLALRSMLRHDPDVILVGEIRDEETMSTAMRAAQTGHLVLSTIHSNSAPETISRALDLTESKGGRDAAVLAETLKFVMAQRLLDRHEGPRRTRELQADETYWLDQSGMGFLRSISEVSPEHRSGKAALLEAIAMTTDIKRALRDPVFDASKVYGLACEQPQYETLASAGVRAMTSRGCLLRDCMVGLETALDAKSHPGFRLRLAQEHGLSLAEVAEVIDAAAKAADEDQPGNIEDFIGVAKAARAGKEQER
jgi:type II secretory ATPase GspE/PulE/Tfp pilus assembly ATPase PilB-like protein